MVPSGQSAETAIYVSTAAKLNSEQTKSITDELLRIIGYPSNYDGFKIHFVSAGDNVEANAFVSSDLKISIGD